MVCFALNNDFPMLDHENKDEIKCIKALKRRSRPTFRAISDQLRASSITATKAGKRENRKRFIKLPSERSENTDLKEEFKQWKIRCRAWTSSQLLKF